MKSNNKISMHSTAELIEHRQLITSSGNQYRLESVRSCAVGDQSHKYKAIDVEVKVTIGRNTIGQYSQETGDYDSQPRPKCMIKKYIGSLEISIRNESSMNHYIRSLPGSEEVVARFIESAYCVTNSSYYLITEKCGENDLFDAVQLTHGGMPERLARLVFGNLARNVKFLHDHGIAHRDLTSMNVILGSNSQVKLIDFEMAVLLSILHGED